MISVFSSVSTPLANKVRNGRRFVIDWQKAFAFVAQTGTKSLELSSAE